MAWRRFFLPLLGCFLGARSGHSLDPFTTTQIASGDVIFDLGHSSYLGTLAQPQITVNATVKNEGFPLLFTVIRHNGPILTGDDLGQIVANYTSRDDVFTTDFLDSIYIASSGAPPVIDSTAASYLVSIGTSRLLVENGCACALANITNLAVSTVRSLDSGATLPSGPYIATVSADSVSISRVYRLYPDIHQDFVAGMYPAKGGTGAHQLLYQFESSFGWPMIPVPSRIYYWEDDRPLAGERVGVKDIYDVKGVKTTRGSKAWYAVANVSDTNGPAIDRLLSLGAVLVGKQKTAQFASAADPWDWDDVQPPFNPRGDGYLTCSASSAGSACSIAAYEWLDYAIGSDTGQSVRRPAAVAGIFGNRPSQGLMDLDGVMPISFTADTAGAFCRDPIKWAKFAKHWYTPSLYQNTTMTHLPALVEPDSSSAFPKKILYATDFLPMANPKAEVILQSFLGNLSAHFNMTMENFNYSNAIEDMAVAKTTNLNEQVEQLTVLWQYDQIQSMAKPFVGIYENEFEGQYPPMDAAHRSYFREAGPTSKDHDVAISVRRAAFDAWEQNVLTSTGDACSDNVLVYDIGSGGLPSFREKDLTADVSAAFLSTPGTPEAGGNICPWFGCADFTLPIGQVSYYSNVTFEEVFMPVTVSLVVRRGCDHMLFNMVEEMAKNGIVNAVKAGKTAF